MRAAIAKALFLLGLTIPIIGVADTGRSCSAGGPCNYTQQQQGNGTNGNIGHHMPGGWTPGSGGMGGGPSASDLAAMEKARKYGSCKSDNYKQKISCNDSAISLHARDSLWCDGAKWVGGAFGLLSGWAYAEGEGAGGVLLGGVAYLIYQKGDSCQTDMDRVKDASLAKCDTDFIGQDLYCESIKP